MITFFTHSPKIGLKESARILLQKIKKTSRGPDAVIKSIERGMKSLNTPYSLNDHKTTLSIVQVVSGIATTKYALKLKKDGEIKTLIVGPNIVVSPNEAEGILFDPAIDGILVPSQWVKDFYVSEAKQNAEFENKIHVWAAGVENNEETSNKGAKPFCIIYNKLSKENITNDVKKYLSDNAIEFKEYVYGTFKRENFFQDLIRSTFMIYMAQSESQGLALAEAWMRNVPTLAYCQGVWNSGSYQWKDEKISAPYLTEECGAFFNNMEEFRKKISLFTNNVQKFHSRKYALANFTDEVTTKRLIDILTSIHHEKSH